MTYKLQALGKVLHHVFINPPGDAYRRKGPVCGNDTIKCTTFAFLDELIAACSFCFHNVTNAAKVLPFIAGWLASSGCQRSMPLSE